MLSRVSGIGAGIPLVYDFGQFLNAVRLLDLSDDLVVFLDEVANHRLQQAHRGVLARVSEMVQVVLELLCSIVSNTDFNQGVLKAGEKVLAKT